MLRKILLLVFLLSFFSNTNAVILDTNQSILSIKGNELNISSYIDTLEIDYMFLLNNQNIESVKDYYINSEIIEDFIRNNFILINNNQLCKINKFEFYKEEIENIFDDGFKVSFQFICKSNISNFKLTLNTFNTFPEQTNSFQIYDLNKNNHQILYKVLNKKENYLQIDKLKTYIPKRKIDSDCDGLSDEDEKIYKTDKFNPDTDGDFYTDKEEVDSKLEPLVSLLGPGQVYRDKLIQLVCKKEKTIIESDEKVKIVNTENYLEKILEYIKTIFNLISK